MARGLAGRRPDLVDGIVTLGSPILAPGSRAPDPALRPHGAGAAAAAPGSAGLMGEDCTSGVCARESWERDPGAAGPRASASPRSSPAATASSTGAAASTRRPRPSRSRTSHLGMAFDPVVLDVVAATLDADRVRRTRELSRQARSAAAPDASAG